MPVTQKAAQQREIRDLKSRIENLEAENRQLKKRVEELALEASNATRGAREDRQVAETLYEKLLMQDLDLASYKAAVKHWQAIALGQIKQKLEAGHRRAGYDAAYAAVRREIMKAGGDRSALRVDLLALSRQTKLPEESLRTAAQEVGLYTYCSVAYGTMEARQKAKADNFGFMYGHPSVPMEPLRGDAAQKAVLDHLTKGLTEEVAAGEDKRAIEEAQKAKRG